MIQFASVTKVIEQAPEPGKSVLLPRFLISLFRYNLENLSSKKNTKYHGWELGKTFEDEGLDGKRHNVRRTENRGPVGGETANLDEPKKKTKTSN